MQKNLWLVLSLFGIILTALEPKALGAQATDANQVIVIGAVVIPNGLFTYPVPMVPVSAIGAAVIPDGVNIPSRGAACNAQEAAVPKSNLCCQDLVSSNMSPCLPVVEIGIDGWPHYPGDIESANWNERTFNDVGEWPEIMNWIAQRWIK